MKYIIRILALPFFAGISLIAAIYLWLRYMANFIKYGGEAITYTKQMQRKSIVDVFNQVQELTQNSK